MLRRLTIVVFALLASAGAAYYVLVVRPLREPHPTPFTARGIVAIEHAAVLTAPEAEPLSDATVLARDGVIVALGTNVPVPTDARRISCNGCTVVAGFWNAHVHFTEAKWRDLVNGDPAALSAALADFTLRRGFTTVIDLGSDLRVTIPIRRRIEHGEVPGPTLLTAGASMYPPDGIPYYLADLPAFIRRQMPQPVTPADASAAEEANIRRGADVLKLFTGSLVSRSTVKPMGVDVARAATAVARSHGQIAFAHPSNAEGMRVAIAGGVSVLAHAPSEASKVDSALIADAIANQVAMIPTLKMFATTVTRDSAFLSPIVEIVRAWHRQHGALLFGTDVGYMTDYTTDEEFALLARAGLTWRDILRMLTTEPADRLDRGGLVSRVLEGNRADLVVLDGDPTKDVSAFARVRAVVRAGAVAWESKR
jgi:imidazolonepropionase-like amidohydrolase